MIWGNQCNHNLTCNHLLGLVLHYVTSARQAYILQEGAGQTTKGK